MFRNICSYVIILVFLFFSSTSFAAVDGREVAVRKVYKNLTRAVMGPNAEVPPLVFSKKKKRVANYSPLTNRIVIEHAALDICSSYGKDSLTAFAIILAHEFAHFSKKHKHGGSYSCRHFMKGEALRERINMEKEADFFGLFSAYLAGYDIHKIPASLMEAIYSTYQLPDDLAAYPHIDIRKKINKEVTRKVDELIDIFETANYLTVMGEYGKAGSCYQAILKDYTSPEIYNNLGLVLALNAQRYIKDKSKFIYPFEIDLDSKLYKDTYGAPLDMEIKSMLNRAIRNFDSALAFNSNSSAALINKACVYELLGDSQACHSTIYDAGKLNLSKQNKEQIKLLKGLLAFHEGNQSEAFKLLERLQTGSNYSKKIATYNLEVMRSGKSQMVSYESEIEDQIYGTVLEGNITFDKAIKVDWSTSSRGNSKKYYSLKSKKIKGSHLFMIKRAGTNNQTFIHRVSSKNSKTTKGIGVGMNAKKVAENYKKEMTTTIATSKGSFIVIPAKGLVFQINENDKVAEWGIVKSY